MAIFQTITIYFLTWSTYFGGPTRAKLERSRRCDALEDAGMVVPEGVYRVKGHMEGLPCLYSIQTDHLTILLHYLPEPTGLRISNHDLNMRGLSPLYKLVMNGRDATNTNIEGVSVEFVLATAVWSGLYPLRSFEWQNGHDLDVISYDTEFAIARNPDLIIHNNISRLMVYGVREKLADLFTVFRLSIDADLHNFMQMWTSRPRGCRDQGISTDSYCWDSLR
ncbi:uncharacterized protein BO88DRAFT_418818 [Aspergillus vadensis CBS 113365]|uniref:Uncharacterized protein n=1 Tax=Aspergillus vadensis (strain CBS 113365 / IMI 142717 / IBT 24658) TaxID=1448311 RepID=A0A319C9F3_ASPVC|nr:hypothetical protein BO88DRAFT_418818 [Aspergillus vadensis CBS 113365]PYH65312.1 hypothetical protein BO88DRAFT_418818 [Aspergillus vadensis CBS 113365]